MFETLTERLGSAFDRLTRRGALQEADVTEALREVRVALLDADVALEVVRPFINQVRERAVGQEVLRSITPGQQVIKIVHDTLVETLGSEASGINLNAVPPQPILMVGLQGSGKTTTTAKLAKRLSGGDPRKVLMASLDVSRPAALEQLQILGEQCGIETLPNAAGETAESIAQRAMTAARLRGYDIVLLDTAGRVSIDGELMAEARRVRDAVNPVETLLVADALTGQDAVNTARNFNEQVGVTGIVLTRMDGDARGGAALSMRAVTGVPVKLVGVGEQLDALEEFHPERVAGRILGMGDVVSLVEKAQQVVEEEEAQRLVSRMAQGRFDLEDMLAHYRQLTNMGGIGGILGMLPGIGKVRKQLDNAGIDDRAMRHKQAIILSMTRQERQSPRLLNASRKRRIARGSGRPLPEVNRVLKEHMEIARAMKRMGKMGLMQKLSTLTGGGEPTPDMLAQMGQVLGRHQQPAGHLALQGRRAGRRRQGRR